MKIVPLKYFDTKNRFYLDKVYATEQSLEIFASTQKNEINIRIFIDDIIHFQVTDESYKVKLIDYLFENYNNENNPSNCYFYEITDDNYMDWINKESFDFFDKEYYKAYIFIFSDSIIEAVSATKPYITNIV